MRLVFIITLLVLIVFISGCVEKQIESTKESSNESKSEVQDSLEEHKETTPTNASEQIGSRLKEWTKESGVRIGGVSSCTIIKNNEYWMYYTGKGIELAKSSDGLNFVYMETVIDVKDINRVDMVTNPSVFKTKDGKYRMIFEGGETMNAVRKLYSAISDDGMDWKVEQGIRLEDSIFQVDEKKGKSGYVVFTSVPDIIRLNETCLRMYYTVVFESRFAISCDDGLTWEKEGKIDLNRIVVDPDIIRFEDGTYKLFFTSFDSQFGVGEQYVMSASSVDGVNFVLDEGKLIEPSTSGGLITDPDVIKIDNGYRMYYGEFRKGEHELYEHEPSIMSAFSSG